VTGDAHCPAGYYAQPEVAGEVGGYRDDVTDGWLFAENKIT